MSRWINFQGFEEKYDMNEEKREEWLLPCGVVYKYRTGTSTIPDTLSVAQVEPSVHHFGSCSSSSTKYVVLKKFQEEESSTSTRLKGNDSNLSKLWNIYDRGYLTLEWTTVLYQGLKDARVVEESSHLSFMILPKHTPYTEFVCVCCIEQCETSLTMVSYEPMRSLSCSKRQARELLVQYAWLDEVPPFPSKRAIMKVAERWEKVRTPSSSFRICSNWHFCLIYESVFLFKPECSAGSLQIPVVVSI